MLCDKLCNKVFCVGLVCNGLFKRTRNVRCTCAVCDFFLFSFNLLFMQALQIRQRVQRVTRQGVWGPLAVSLLALFTIVYAVVFVLADSYGGGPLSHILELNDDDNSNEPFAQEIQTNPGMKKRDFSPPYDVGLPPVHLLLVFNLMIFPRPVTDKLLMHGMHCISTFRSSLMMQPCRETSRSVGFFFHFHMWTGVFGSFWQRPSSLKYAMRTCGVSSGSLAVWALGRRFCS
mmetsp:Transcript_15417/g.25480  ORF Transcript_15417/g.25480 Transcript_15417/m.25480 type:complete len:231 (-) Transcript_15417:1518-2210(-)